MKRFLTPFFLTFVFVSIATADEKTIGNKTAHITKVSDPAVRPAESLLAHDSIVFLQFDGFDRNRQAYDKTVLAKAMKEDLGPLVDYIVKAIVNAVGPDIVAEKLLDGTAPMDLVHLQKAAKQLPLFLNYLNGHGVMLGLEVVPGNLVPDVQVTLVFPNAGKDSFRKAILGSVRLWAIHADSKITQSKISGRDVTQFPIGGGTKIRCWQEGPHMVCTIGTMEIQRTLDLAKGDQQKTLLANPRLKQLKDFQAYKTYARGFVDIHRALAVTRAAVPPAGKVIDDTGAAGLDQLSFHLGYEEQYQRSTFALSTLKREGVLKLLAATSPVKWEQLPALPPDATSVLAGRVDLSKALETVIETIENVIQVIEPTQLESFRSDVKNFYSIYGIDLRRDLLDSLGPTTLIYTSPGEGPFILGMAAVFEAKDPKKLNGILQKLMQNLKNINDSQVSVSRSMFRGVPIYSLKVKEDFFPFTPAVAVYDGWLVVGMFPQTIQGFILRQKGKIANLKPSPLLQKTMKKHGIDVGGIIVGFSQSDPRHIVKQVGAIAPIVGTLLRSNVKALKDFDVGLIPNSQSLTEKLSPNVGLIVDDGRSLRVESYSTVSVPIVLTGLDAYFLVLLVSGFGFFFQFM